MVSPKVSVVMSVYNGMPYLRDAVESILNQTLHDFEFIIIDDGSTDGTSQLIKDYASCDPRIVILENDENIGYSRSLNKGFARACGSYIARQDADDISLPDRFEKQLAYFDRHPDVGLLGTRPIFIDENDEIIQDSSYIFVSRPEDIPSRLMDNNCIHHGSIMVRKEIIDQVGFYKVELEPSEDYDLWLRISEISKIANLEEGLYKYREHKQSISSKKRTIQMRNKAIALERAIIRRCGPHAAETEFKNASRDYFRAAIIGFISYSKEDARDSLEKCLTLYPKFLEQNDLVYDIIRKYTLDKDPKEAIPLIQEIFSSLLPEKASLSKVYARLVSEKYIDIFFQEINDPDTKQARQSLIKGIRLNPGWLLNRGIISYLLKHSLR